MRRLRDLKYRVIRLLDETIIDDGETPVYSNAYPAELILDGIHSAYEAILIAVWKRSVLEIPSGVTLVKLPDDLYRIEGVWDNESGSFSRPLSISVGEMRVDDGSEIIWADYPSGYMTLTGELVSGGSLYYAGRYPLPHIDDDFVEIPDFAHNALSLYAASYCLLPKAVSIAGIRQYPDPTAKGSAEENPLKKLSDYFLHRYDIEIGNFPKQTKGMK